MLSTVLRSFSPRDPAAVEFRAAKRRFKRNNRGLLLKWQAGTCLAMLAGLCVYYGGALGSPVTWDGRVVEQGDVTLMNGQRALLSCTNGTGHDTTFFGAKDIWEDDEERLTSGAIVLHIFFLLYTFVGIAQVADGYFEPCLAAISDALSLSDDVAGATFMAAGSSAPEFFTSLMGVFVAKSDVGVGTIVGSAVFNILIIIGCCALVAPGIEISWYPLTRDVLFYSASIILLVIAIVDSEVQWWEALLLLILYAGYIYAMKRYVCTCVSVCI
jgi:Ca2+/H+ antiporter